MMREAVSLMGGYGVTEDCPGFLGHKWMDAQLEATYEGPEAVQRRQLSITMTTPLFLAQFQRWMHQMRRIASERPGSGACTHRLRHAALALDVEPPPERHRRGRRQAGTKGRVKGSPSRWPTPFAGSWRRGFQILDTIELETKGQSNPAIAEGLPGLVAFLTDLCHVQSARAAGEVGRICAELVHGYNRHPAWDASSCGACYCADDLDGLEGLIPGIASSARGFSDVTEAGEIHPVKAGPCVQFSGLEEFARLRAQPRRMPHRRPAWPKTALRRLSPKS